ncbi:MAG TPA: phytanoyl-CoA dioxygenase family protein [Chthonomonadaceae bacterium]|nr:phytanoyl-CoA dioxygenase family protein [Chthonomonadaceae bacterium]
MTADFYWARRQASNAQIQAWVEQFHRDGYLFLENVLPPDWVAELKADLDRALADREDNGSGVIDLHCRMFETSPANLRLFDMEPIVTFAETLVEKNCHVVHNNSFRTPIGKGIITWHQDDPPHYLITHGEPPTNIRLPVLLFSCNYYLTDVTGVAHGPFQVVPGSHLFGASPPSNVEGTRWEEKIISCLGPAGSVVMFNNQVWHRGGPNHSDRVRYVTQVSYGRRMVNHFFYPFMNYQMPEHVTRNANPRLKRLLGFLPSGAYG